MIYISFDFIQLAPHRSSSPLNPLPAHFSTREVAGDHPQQPPRNAAAAPAEAAHEVLVGTRFRRSPRRCFRYFFRAAHVLSSKPLLQGWVHLDIAWQPGRQATAVLIQKTPSSTWQCVGEPGLAGARTSLLVPTGPRSGGRRLSSTALFCSHVFFGVHEVRLQ